MWKHLLLPVGRSNRIEFVTWGLILQVLSSGYLIGQFLGVKQPAELSVGMLVLSLLVLLWMPVGLMAGWMWLMLVIRRMHDLNISGWWLLVLVGFGICSLFMPQLFNYGVSLVGLGFTCWLLLTPGTSGENNYGLPAERNYAPAFATGKAGFSILAALFLALTIGTQVYSMYQAKQFQAQYEQLQQQLLQQTR